MTDIIFSLQSMGFTIENDMVSFDGIYFAKISTREKGSLDCYPFVIWGDEDEKTYLDANNTILASDAFYSYYDGFFLKYDKLFNKNENGTRFKLNSTSNEEVNLVAFMRDVVTIYLQIKSDLTSEMIANF